MRMWFCPETLQIVVVIFGDVTKIVNQRFIFAMPDRPRELSRLTARAAGSSIQPI